MSNFSFRDKFRKSYKSFSPVSRHSYKSIEEWLEALKLTNYINLFKKYKDIEDVLKLSESSLKRLGIKNASDRARMMSSIALLRDSAKKSAAAAAIRLERLKQEASIPRSIYKLLFHSNKTLTSPVGFVPSLGLPSTRDLEGVIWYHGMISRLEAETLVMTDGDFLVRNSSTHPGELVLTSYKENKPMHFVINCIEFQKGGHGVNEKFYKFDDEAFPSITSLITYHMKSGKPITPMSEVVLLNPIPLHSQRIPTLKRTVAAPRIREKKNDDGSVHDKWTGSQPLLSLGESSPMRTSLSLAASLERYGSMPSMFKNHRDASRSPLARQTSKGSAGKLACYNQRTTKHLSSTSNTNISSTISSDTYLNPKTTTDIQHLPPPPDHFLLLQPPTISVIPPVELPPPKPSRVPTLRFADASYRPMVKVRNDALYSNDSEDDIDDAAEKPTLRAAGDDDLDNNAGSYLPLNVRPLDPVIMVKITSLVLNSQPATIARHVTHVDVKVLRIVPINDCELNLISGLELLTLPQGHLLRQDVIERHYCMGMFISSMVLKGQSVKERSDLLSHWLSVAMELKMNMRNTFSFYSVMDALCSSQVVRLKSSWRFVKLNHGSVFELFETKLLPAYRTLLDASGLTLPHQRDTITPHIFPFLELLERPSTLVEEEGAWKLGSWELNQPFFGLDVILVHLETARLLTGRIHLYRDATEKFLASSSLPLAADLLDILDPGTQAKFLWGSKGMLAERSERLAKFDHLLSLLSEIVEKNEGGSE